jgi:hypothetical protein
MQEESTEITTRKNLPGLQRGSTRLTNKEEGQMRWKEKEGGEIQDWESECGRFTVRTTLDGYSLYDGTELVAANCYSQEKAQDKAVDVIYAEEARGLNTQEGYHKREHLREVLTKMAFCAEEADAISTEARQQINDVLKQEGDKDANRVF